MTSQSPDVMDCSVSVLVLGFEWRENGNIYKIKTDLHINLRNTGSFCTWEMDMEMWKNFPLPPCGMARVKKSFKPSLENRGFSF